MTVEQFRQEIDDIITRNVKQAKPFQRAVATVHGEMSQRIFEQGEAADGSQIGQYSTTPGTYGMPGKKAKFYPGGYKQFKQDVGRQSSFVDLKLTRSLQVDFSNGLRKLTPLKYQVAVNQGKNASKWIELEDKYGKDIFDASKSEVDRIQKIIADEMI